MPHLPQMSAATDYLTITSRSFIVPELGVTLRFESIEPPEELIPFLTGHATAEDGAIEDRLEEVCQQIFSVPSANVLSFSRWREMSFQLSKFTADAGPELRSLLTGEELVAGEKWLRLMNVLTSLPHDTYTFVGTYLTNGVLNPMQSRRASADFLGLSRYVEDPKALERLSAILPSGLSELDVERWQDLSRTLAARPLRSAAAASETLNQYQLPLPGSPQVKLLTMEQFKKFCYGAATLLIGNSTYSAIQHPNSSVLACVLGGAVPALVLVSTASVAEFLDNYLNGQAAKAKRAAKRASTSRTRKAA
jgi:hypothetical protein